MDLIYFFVPGEPRGKGRPRFSRVSGVAYTDSETKAYERKIAAYYHKAAQGFRFPETAFLTVDIHAYLPIPKGTSKSKTAAMAEGKIPPSRKPDIDNIIKAVLDGLNGVAYKDDARVIQVSGKKRYGLDPGVAVYIWARDGGACAEQNY